MDQILIDTKEEKEKILEKIFNKTLKFSFLNNLELNNTTAQNEENSDNNETTENTNNLIINEINQYLPESIILNSQIPYLRKLPLIRDND
jgi:6-pyruvoyl-tetrahydropterin synthase